ncbi:hypothetical protein KGY73_07500 [bacterium]|nr:hypothetical protein [bacterium]
MKDSPICNPKPIKNFAHRRVLYFPMDIPSRLLLKFLSKKAAKEKKTPYGHFFLLPDKTVLLNAMSAPLAAFSVERLIASGATEIFLLGFCGAIDPRIKTGELVSASKAHSEEGTSHHYFPRRRVFYPSFSLKQQLENFLPSQISYNSLAVVSTDAPYRETRSWIKEKQKKQIGAVDMETSAVFSLSEFHGILSTSLMIISDELSSGAWKTGFHSASLESSVRECFLPLIQKI